MAFHKDYEQFLIELRNLGMIHIVEQDRTELDEEELYPYTSKLKQLEGAVKTLKRYRDNNNEDSFNEPDIELGQRIPEEIEKIENFKSSLNQQLQVSIKESNLLKPWGNFDPENIKKNLREPDTGSTSSLLRTINMIRSGKHFTMQLS